MRSTLIAIFCTFFEMFDVPVFWPILVMYFVVLVCLTMKRQIMVSMLCYKSGPTISIYIYVYIYILFNNINFSIWSNIAIFPSQLVNQNQKEKKRPELLLRANIRNFYQILNYYYPRNFLRSNLIPRCSLHSTSLLNLHNNFQLIFLCGPCSRTFKRNIKEAQYTLNIKH